MRIAVVGAGPAGVYAAETLIGHDGVRVDVIERLPAPFGLVRYGVAPDHLPLRGVRDTLARVLQRDGVRLLAGIEVGVDVELGTLRDCYDAVVLTYGAARDRRMGIPGEDLTGSIAATDLVNWYCGHPDAPSAVVEEALRQAHTAVVVGVGNVAVDVARVLTKSAAALSATDMPQHVLDLLADSRIREVHVVGRRGPAQASWTTKELRELGDLADVDVVVDAPPLDLLVTPETERHTAKNLQILQGFSYRDPTGAPRRLSLDFWRRPVALEGADRVERVVLEHTELDAEDRCVGTGRTTSLDAQLVVRSIGYRGVPLADLHFDDARGVVHNDGGRIVDVAGAVVPGVYVAGWIKRGPTGIIGTNRKDAAETVAALLADSDAGLLPAPTASIDAVLAAAGVVPVGYDGWTLIDAAERSLGASRGRDRTTIHDRAALLGAARPQ